MRCCMLAAWVAYAEWQASVEAPGQPSGCKPHQGEVCTVCQVLFLDCHGS
jgi:hypothetical protein